MNTPNKLTMLRMILVPVFLAFLLAVRMPGHLLAAAACFAVASVTDLIDGKIARRYNQVTNFGKLMDPLADKLLVAAALVGFVQLGLADAWVAVIILSREFLVTSVRLVAAGSGKVIPANIWGKLKTNIQIFAILLTMAGGFFGWPAAVGGAALWVSAAVTVISGAQYVWAYRAYIDVAK